jgi:hypothetical protein
LRRKQKEDAEETETKKSRVISYMDEDDDGKEVEHDVEKKERKRKVRLVFLMSAHLSCLNGMDSQSENVHTNLRLIHIRPFLLIILEYLGKT